MTDYTCSRLYSYLDAFQPMEVKNNYRSSWVNLAFTVFSKIFNSHSINMNDPVYLPRLLKACSHSLCLHCIRDVFSNKGSKKAMMQFFGGMISKIKIRIISELQ